MPLQRWSHKTALALHARNDELSSFYLHELEETVEEIQSGVPTYEGYEIARLTEEMLLPEVETLEEALDERDWEAVDNRVQNLSAAWNRCHRATDHGFIPVDLRDVSNPYAQQFEPSSP